MKSDSMEHLLQPLRVPRGWLISYNIFTAFEPLPEHMEYFYGEWLWGASNHSQSVSLELRYEPEGDPQGEFVLEFCRVKTTGSASPELTLIQEVRSRSTKEVVAAMERIMWDPWQEGAER